MVNTCVDLGVTRSSDFTYDEYMSNVITKAFRATGMILRVFSTKHAIFDQHKCSVHIGVRVAGTELVYCSLTTDTERVLRRYNKKFPTLHAFP